MASLPLPDMLNVKQEAVDEEEKALRDEMQVLAWV